MDRESFLANRLPALENQWRETGDPDALAEVVALCGWNGWPLPEWAVEPILGALRLFSETGERGRGTPASRIQNRFNETVRHDLVVRVLAAPMDFTGKKRVSVDEACEVVARMLKGQNVSARAVKNSFHKVERTLKQAI